MFAVKCVVLMAGASAAPNNMNPVEYEIANPSPGHTRLREHRGEFFEILGPVKTSQYSEVNWASGSTSLPEEIVRRFDGKVIAITGYEVDIIRKDASGKETSVPCYELYNHHYSGWMHGKAMQQRRADLGKSQVGPHGTRLPQWGRVAETTRTQNCDIDGIWLNPGNNIRVNITTAKSGDIYTCSVCGHVYDPAKDGNGVPFEQLPDTWVCPVCGAPKSKYKKTVDKAGRVQWAHGEDEPQRFNASCIGPKGWRRGYGSVTAPSTTHPQGGAILFVADDPGANTHGFFSSANNGQAPQCSELTWADGNVWFREPYTPDAPTVAPTVQAFSEGNGNEHRVSFKGYAKGYAQLVHSPVAFVNSPMIINMNKRLTGESTPGVVASLQPRLSIAPRGPDAKYSGILECPCTTRKVKLVDRYYSLPLHDCPPVTIEATSVPSRVSTSAECQTAAEKTLQTKAVDLAIVHSSTLPPGCSYAGSAVTFNNNSESTAACQSSQQCICRDATSQGGSIGGMRFNRGKCAQAPTSDLLTTNNGICNISAYEGCDPISGLMCCGGGTFLLDADQQVPAPVDTFQDTHARCTTIKDISSTIRKLKYRFYFEEYHNQSNAYRVWWSTEATNNEYDCPKSTADCLNPATNASLCTHVIRSVFRGRDMLKPGAGCMVHGDPAACIDPAKIAARDDGVFNLVYAAAHCHAPGCIALELWDDDRSELICRNEAKIGTNNSKDMNEEGFVVGIPPCVWGSTEDGLLAPPRIHLDSNLSTIKYTNNTFGHWGIMALWQMRATYATGH